MKILKFIKSNLKDIIPELNDKQLNRLSEYLGNFSLLVIASLVIPNLIGNKTFNSLEIASGIIISIMLVSSSIYILKKTNE